MKSYFLSLFGFLFFSQAFSQFVSSVGISTGLTNSQLIWKEIVSDGSTGDHWSEKLLRLNASAFMEFSKKKNWSLQLSVGYLEKGSGQKEQSIFISSVVLPYLTTSFTINGNLNF